MENTKEMSRVEQALQTMRDEIRKAFLNEELKAEYMPDDHPGYYAHVKVGVGNVKFSMTIADTFVSYHNEFIKGIFDKKEDFEALTELVNKHVKILTSEEKAKIVALQAEIDAIKKGAQA